MKQINDKIFILSIIIVFTIILLTFCVGRASDEFPIATTTGTEEAASAAFDGTNYLVGIQGDADFQTNVTAQLVSKAGTLVGSRIKTGGTGGTPFVAFDGTNYLMVWAEDAPRSTRIYGQFISKAGAIIGSQITIGTGSDMRLSFNSVLFDGTNYFVAWENRIAPYGGDTANIYGQFITASGTLLGEAIPISTVGRGQRMPTMAFDGTNILVVWVDGRNQSACYADNEGTHCFESDIYGQFVAKSSAEAAGDLIGDNFAISTSSLPRDNPPGVAFDGTTYLVTFQEQTTLPSACPQTGCKWDVFGQFISTAGNPVGSKTTISTTAANHLFPIPVYNGINYLITWTEGFGSTEATIKGRFFDKSGSPVGSELTLFSPSDNRVPWLAAAISDGSRYFAFVNRGTPGADPEDIDTYTNQDVFGAFINPLPSNQHTLTVTKAGTGNGTVTSSPAGINCGADCSETYAKPTKVKLTAKADVSSTFTGWSGGGCSGTKTCTVMVDTAVTVTADFVLRIPDISVAQTTLEFDSIKVGKKGTKTLKIMNNGTGDLSITLSGLESPDFNIQGNSSVTIKPKKSYNLKVLFTPKTAGLKTATLNINSNDPDTPELSIALSGSTVEQPQQYTLMVTKAGTGSGTVSSNPAGINCGSDCSEAYVSGTSVTLTATPDSSSTFTGWSGECSGTGACVVSMTSDKAATASFALQQYVLTVAKTGTGSGTVTSNPAGINCGADCNEVYNHGTSVTLTAAPDTGSTFTGWSGECSGTGACVVSMTGDKAATASFALQQYTLAVTKAGTGSGTVTSNPAGINCGADCNEAYNYGTSVTLTATPDAGSVFTGWSGDCSGTGACVFSMTGDKAATATFALQQYTLTVTKAGTGSGTVTSDPAGINCGGDCSEVYNYGTSVTLTATPDAGSTFTGWSGDCSGTGACVVSMTSDKAATATFTASYDGTWNGTTSQGKEFSLTVTNNAIPTVKYGISCGGTQINATTNFTPPVQIIGNNFSVGGIMVGIWDGITIRMHTVTISGTFGSATSASGTIGISGSVCNASATWTAIK